MDTIENLKSIEWFYVFVAVLTLLFAVKYVIELVKWFMNLFGVETKNMRQKREEHELLIKTTKNLEELHNKHEEDTKQSIKHDKMIRDDLKKLAETVDSIAERLDTMQNKIDATEMAKLKDKILGYYRKYKETGEWERFEADTFWGLYDRYITHGGNTFVIHDIEPAMRELKVID